ncbi:hypothetical protein ABZP36_020040 [Zizania latifolia]
MEPAESSAAVEMRELFYRMADSRRGVRHCRPCRAWRRKGGHMAAWEVPRQSRPSISARAVRIRPNSQKAHLWGSAAATAVDPNPIAAAQLFLPKSPRLLLLPTPISAAVQRQQINPQILQICSPPMEADVSIATPTLVRDLS